MKKIKLYQNREKNSSLNEYDLNPTEKYVIDMDEEMEFQAAIMMSKPLWKSAYSQGIVVMAENDTDYFIVMECSNKNKGYKNTKIILTPGGCI